MTDQQIIEALIARDERATQQFFFKSCRPLFMSIMRNVFSYEVDYDEFVNEFYLHLMENDAYRLRQFQGRSTIYQWMKVIAIRYFIAKRNNMIDMEPKVNLFENEIHEDSDKCKNGYRAPVFNDAKQALCPCNKTIGPGRSRAQRGGNGADDQCRQFV